MRPFRIRFCLAVLLAAILFPAASIFGQSTASQIGYAAPKDCLAFVSWNATAEKAISGNSTQALMAEPEVRRFVDDLQVRMGLLVPATSGAMPKLKNELLHWLSPRFAEAVFERSGCLYLEGIEISRENPSKLVLKAAMLFDGGTESAKFAKRLATFVRVEGQVNETFELAGTKAHVVGLPDVPFNLYVASQGSTVVLATSKDSFKGAIERLSAKEEPAWLTSLRKKSDQLSHVHSLGYLNTKSILKVANKFAGPNAGVVAELLGLANVSKVELIGGLNNKNSSVHVLLETDDPDGLLGLVANNSLNEEVLESIPADALGAYSLSVDAKETLVLLQSAEQLMGVRRSAIEEFRNMLQRGANIDLNDLLDNFGKTWLVYCGASDGWLSGTTIAVETRDSAKLADLVETWFTSMAEMTKEIPIRYRPTFFKQPAGESNIFSISAYEFVFEPSFCVTENRLLLAMFPQAIRSAANQKTTDAKLFDSMQLTKFRESKFLTGAPHVSGLAYDDTAKQLQLIYPLVQFVKANIHEALYPRPSANLGALIDGFQLPPARTVIKHIEPTLAVLRTSKDGVEFELTQTLPTNAVAASLPAIVGMLIPAISEAQTSVKSTRSANNLRQIALATLNYESAHMRFPTNGPMKRNGKHKFSWRVHVLPFIEQGNLYNQFRFDEPWDSDHNKKLIAQMPDIYKSPFSKADQGLTVYRGFGGDRGVLGVEKGKVTFGTMTDGSSNTILTFEVGDELAVPWTKPESLSTDEAEFEKFFGERKFGWAAFCDGSVQRMMANTPADQMQHLVERNDGFVVDRDNFARNPRQQESTNVDERFMTPGLKESLR